MTEQKISRWIAFRHVIAVRYNKPKSHPEFVFIFILLNLIFCALGVYVSMFADLFDSSKSFNYRALNTNLTTYYIAILASACFDLILSKAKIMKSALTTFSLAVLVFGIISLIVSYLLRLRYALPLTILYLLISLFMWWIANAENDKLMNDEVPPSATIGDLDQEILGDLGGFKT